VSKKRRPALIFSTMDCWGNQVDLEEERWNSHIVWEHGTMSGHEQVVQKTVEDPAEIFLSTHLNTAVAHVSAPGVGPSPLGVRVLVGYSDVHYQKGGSTGKILTAYPIDLIRYGHPMLGKSIYKKGGKK
jgi:hypothetical protein